MVDEEIYVEALLSSAVPSNQYFHNQQSKPTVATKYINFHSYIIVVTILNTKNK
jgi:hypothetical protein